MSIAAPDDDVPRSMRLWAATAGRLLLAAVWLVAGALKIPDPADSVRAVRAYRLLPEAVVPTIGYALPFVELALGGLLLAGFAVRIGAIASVVLLAAFLVQPPEGTPGLSDDELIRLGVDSGADGEDYARCVRELRYQPWTRWVTDEASKRGINATPTVLVNGQPLQAPTPDAVRAAVENAAAPG